MDRLMTGDAGWTDEKIIQLKRLWLEGMTTAAIGKLLGTSKNAVVGKVHRLELRGRQSPIKVDKKATKTKKKPPRIYTMADLSSQPCRWPSGDPKHDDFQFCGRPAEQ